MAEGILEKAKRISQDLSTFELVLKEWNIKSTTHSNDNKTVYYYCRNKLAHDCKRQLRITTTYSSDLVINIAIKNDHSLLCKSNPNTDKNDFKVECLNFYNLGITRPRELFELLKKT